MEKKDAQELLASVSLTSVTIMEMLLNVTNFFLLPYFFVRISSAKLIHKNLRTMLLSLSVGLGLFNVTRFWQGIMYFMLAAFDYVQRHAIMFNYQCWITRFVYDTSMTVFAITMCSMAIERIIATIAVKRYEQKESTKFSVSIVLMQWATGVLVALYFEIGDIVSSVETNWNSSELQMTCSLIILHSMVVLIEFIIGFIGFGIFTVILFILYRYNALKYKTRTLTGLTVRYQLAENITTLRFLLPLVLLFGILYGTSLIFVVFLNTQIKKGPATSLHVVKLLAFIVKMVNLPGAIYTTAFCCLCLFLHGPLRKTVKEDFARLSGRLLRKQSKTAIVTSMNASQKRNVDEGDIYFKNFQRVWH